MAYVPAIDRRQRTIDWTAHRIIHNQNIFQADLLLTVLTKKGLALPARRDLVDDKAKDTWSESEWVEEITIERTSQAKWLLPPSQLLTFPLEGCHMVPRKSWPEP
jgi:hypothetical protein